MLLLFLFFFQAEDGIRDGHVTGVQTCALPILASESLILTVSMNSSSSSWSSPSTSPNARKRWITSSVNPGVVKILVRYMSSSAESPVSSSSSLLAQLSQSSPLRSGLSAGTSLRYTPDAYRYCLIRTISGSASPGSPRIGSTAAAPECLIISSWPVEPSWNLTVSIERSTILPSKIGSLSISGESSVSISAISAILSCIRSEEHTSELQSRGHLVCRL